MCVLRNRFWIALVLHGYLDFATSEAKTNFVDLLPFVGSRGDDSGYRRGAAPFRALAAHRKRLFTRHNIHRLSRMGPPRAIGDEIACAGNVNCAT
jgi:hypothetical protein